MAKPKPNIFTDAQKSKRYRDKKKQKEDTFSRTQKKVYLQAKQKIAQRRKTKNTKSTNTNKPVKVLGVVEKQSCNMSSSMNWMNKASTLQNHKYKRLETNMRHCCPTFCTGNTKVGTDSDIWLLDDSGKWQFWFSRRISQFVGAGLGLIAGRDFKSDSIITRYMGKTTTSQKVSDNWKKSSGYVFEFKKKGRTNTSQKQWVCPDMNETYMYAHFINHSKTPNCQVDEYSGIFTSIHDIKNGEELTIDYGVDYDYTW
jgi:hypothetical protein